jgi:hypothetical protein
MTIFGHGTGDTTSPAKYPGEQLAGLAHEGATPRPQPALSLCRRRIRRRAHLAAGPGCLALLLQLSPRGRLRLRVDPELSCTGGAGVRQLEREHPQAELPVLLLALFLRPLVAPRYRCHGEMRAWFGHGRRAVSAGLHARAAGPRRRQKRNARSREASAPGSCMPC